MEGRSPSVLQNRYLRPASPTPRDRTTPSNVNAWRAAAQQVPDETQESSPCLRVNADPATPPGQATGALAAESTTRRAREGRDCAEDPPHPRPHPQATPTHPCSGPCEARAHRGSGRVAVVTGDALRGANRRASGAGCGSRKCVAAGAMAALSVVCLLLAAASWRPVSASGEEFWPGQSAADILSGVASCRR